ncbi:hypothetical protein ACH95_12710 [Bacillus glycinifermentans]|uniref:immunity 50 family protein n=1 Tax=Bacillus glycinifermentans TaxID=1664069 RepID=UPI000652BBC5|nr:immunity 50 family protein [Bacillus glycinifermentans]KMM59024.1 hypothetical protein ACH95_12710 [Bacillus glycinifermentans]MEC0496072.1 immunity 50 family protein [Bacillus glycinifermentans]MEC0539191.1 immunity 50 family protein [Bacillus glycinifermentans]MEC3605985.1 immunity 50 family protein [Bacillus glycinifermentans]
MINQAKFMNPQAMTNIFGGMPQFTGSELMNVELRRDGPCLLIRFMTKEKVENQPKRWDKWDVIYIEMSFIGVRNLNIKDIGTDNIINQFEIDEAEEANSFKIKCLNQMQIECIFEWARIDRITPGLLDT